MSDGRIDIHSHLLPGIDDGCIDQNESFACVRRLQAAGYVASICTPHVVPDIYPHNTPTNIHQWTIHLAAQFAEAGVSYQLWPGGELRLFKGAEKWMREHGVPTLAASRCVLFDHWDQKWPRWADKIIQWLIDEKYQPIMAHPERTNANYHQPHKLDEFVAMGVWLQGNFRAITGEDGYIADQLTRQYLAAQRYQLMALDMHGPDSLAGRLDGMRLVAMEHGQALVDHFTITAPRQLIFGQRS
jgi:protein-tyrosine phosphatase